MVRAPVFREEACPRPSTTFESQADILADMGNEGGEAMSDVVNVDEGGDRADKGKESAIQSPLSSTDVPGSAPLPPVIPMPTPPST